MVFQRPNIYKQYSESCLTLTSRIEFLLQSKSIRRGTRGTAFCGTEQMKDNQRQSGHVGGGGEGGGVCS